MARSSTVPVLLTSTPSLYLHISARGNAREAKGDLDGAIAEYTRAIELDPRYADAYLNRANTQADKGDMGHAIADYNRALEINPALARAYAGRGGVKGDLDGALSDYSRSRNGPTGP